MIFFIEIEAYGSPLMFIRKVIDLDQKLSQKNKKNKSTTHIIIYSWNF